MRSIQASLTPDLASLLHGKTVDSAEPFPTRTYRQLVEHVARLSFVNKDQLLFFRGQGTDFRNKAGASTFYPTIYRGDYVPHREVRHRFDILDSAARSLSELFSEHTVEGHQEVRRKQYIQWSILQHYEVCETPLLDFTHSLRVACSFAQMASDSDRAFVYAFGLPYITNRITINSEHDLVNVRLLSICPPDALRPYFQEGYLAGTTDITTDYDSKTELDFKNRLIAKFEIANSDRFWGQGFTRVPEEALYPADDRVKDLCKSIETSVKSELQPGQLGEFVRAWSDFEERLLHLARRRDARIYSLRESIDRLVDDGYFSEDVAYQLHELRKFRNLVVHEPRKVDPEDLAIYLQKARAMESQLG